MRRASTQALFACQEVFYLAEPQRNKRGVVCSEAVHPCEVCGGALHAMEDPDVGYRAVVVASERLTTTEDGKAVPEGSLFRIGLDVSLHIETRKRRVKPDTRGGVLFRERFRWAQITTARNLFAEVRTDVYTGAPPFHPHLRTPNVATPCLVLLHPAPSIDCTRTRLPSTYLNTGESSVCLQGIRHRQPMI